LLLNHKTGADQKVVEFFFDVLNIISSNIAPESILTELRKNPDYQYLPEKVAPLTEEDKDSFSSSQKSEIFIKEAIKHLPRCSICKGYIHCNSISIDHIERLQDGGRSIVTNGQITHPYCNTGYKN